MSVILHIESATDGCSVAVSDEGQLVFDKSDRVGHNNAVTLGVLVDEALSLVDSRGLKLDAVAVSEGPGSYSHRLRTSRHRCRPLPSLSPGIPCWHAPRPPTGR